MNWRTFLDDIFLGDKEIINFAQNVVGYASTGDMTAGIIVVCKGHGRNGRSMFFRALHAALGDKLVFCHQGMLSRSMRPGAPSPELLELKGAALAVMEGSELLVRDELSLVKMLASGDRVFSRGVWAKDAETFYNQATPFLVCAGFSPKVMADAAFWDRLVFIPFPVRFMPGHHAANTWKKALRADTVFPALKNDMKSIRAWIEEGARRFRENGLSIPERFRSSAQTARRVA